jgi:hypothetical protein
LAYGSIWRRSPVSGLNPLMMTVGDPSAHPGSTGPVVMVVQRRAAWHMLISTIDRAIFDAWPW